MKTIKEINEKIKKGKATIIRADQMPEIIEKKGAQKTAQKVDIVTTGTFGAMCSSGAFINFGHSDPPIKMQKLWLNEVEAYAGLAAVDAYIGATELSLDRGMKYGGAHVIEDLVAGKPIHVRSTAYGTDCYPKKYLETTVTLTDLNQAYLYNPRNNYQRYVAATNSSNKPLYTYMGLLLPELRNINYAGCGEISPLNNDPTYQTIGLGTRIFLGGGQGYVVSEGTQHSPTTSFGTIAVKGDLDTMDTKYIRGGTIAKYGTTLFVGIGVPIPVLTPEIAQAAAVTNRELTTNLIDYGIPKRDRPTLKKVTYEELATGKVELNGKKIKTQNLSSMRIAYEIADELGKQINDKEFYLTAPVERLPQDTIFKPLITAYKIPSASEVMTAPPITVLESKTVKDVSTILVEKGIDQVPIVDSEDHIRGIITSWDITKASAEGVKKLADVMTKNVITATPDDSLDAVQRKLEKHEINSVPIVDEQKKVRGIITLSDINRYYSR